MSFTTTTRKDDERLAALRAACAEIVREEAEEFRESDVRGVVFDRRYRARRRAFLRGERYPVLKLGRRYLPHLAACAAIVILAGGVMWHRIADPKATDKAADGATYGDSTQAGVPTGALDGAAPGEGTAAGASPGDGLTGDISTEDDDKKAGASPSETKEIDRTRLDWELQGWGNTETRTLERDGVTLTLIGSAEAVYLCDMTSESEHITVSDVSGGMARENVRAILYRETAFPNALSLTFGEGIHYLSFGWGEDAMAERFPKLEKLVLPASLKNIYCSTDLMESLTASAPAEYRSLQYTFPPSLAALERIEVATGNAFFWDEDGMLYGNSFVKLEVSEGDYPQGQLLCLPRNYSGAVTAGGVRTVVLPSGTDYIHTGAVYRCHIDRLVIPESVTRIAPAAIVASADRPLVIVGDKGSAAEEYVRMFGERYHLTFEVLG